MTQCSLLKISCIQKLGSLVEIFQERDLQCGKTLAGILLSLTIIYEFRELKKQMKKRNSSRANCDLWRLFITGEERMQRTDREILTTEKLTMGGDTPVHKQQLETPSLIWATTKQTLQSFVLKWDESRNGERRIPRTQNLHTDGSRADTSH